MKETPLAVGMIMQIDPGTVRNKAFGGCMFVVTEPKSWGAMGFVQSLGLNGEPPGGQAYYRAKWEEMEPTGGYAVFMPCPPEDEP